MENKIVLSPEQLYYMGRLLQAKYIDYAYIAAMRDIGQKFSLFEAEAKASLVAAGVLMEDFGGNIEVDPTVQSILKPIFFGEIETSIDICNVGELTTVVAYKYHFYDGIVTMVTGENDKFAIRTVDQLEIRDQVEALVSKAYAAENRKVDTVDKSHITRIVSVKKVHVEKTAIVKTYIEADQIFYQETEGTVESVTRDQFISDAFDVVKGG